MKINLEIVLCSKKGLMSYKSVYPQNRYNKRKYQPNFTPEHSGLKWKRFLCHIILVIIIFCISHS